MHELRHDSEDTPRVALREALLHPRWIVRVEQREIVGLRRRLLQRRPRCLHVTAGQRLTSLRGRTGTVPEGPCVGFSAVTRWWLASLAILGFALGGRWFGFPQLRVPSGSCSLHRYDCGMCSLP